jgi:hypothetical protein
MTTTKNITIIILFITSIFTATYFCVIKPMAEYKPVQFGAYDPDNELTYSSSVVTDEVEYSLVKPNLEQLSQQSQTAISHKRSLVVTVNNANTSETLKQEDKDKAIQELCQVLSPVNTKINFIPNSEYTDSLTDQYSQFYTICDKTQKGHYYIYNISQDSISKPMLPDSKQFNAIGYPLTMNALSYYDKGLDLPIFTDLLKPYHQLAVANNKDLIVTKLRIEGQDTMRKKWFWVAKQFIAENKIYPNLKLVILDNSNPHKYPTNWLDKSVF